MPFPCFRRPFGAYRSGAFGREIVRRPVYGHAAGRLPLRDGWAIFRGEQERKRVIFARNRRDGLRYVASRTGEHFKPLSFVLSYLYDLRSGAAPPLERHGRLERAVRNQIVSASFAFRYRRTARTGTAAFRCGAYAYAVHDGATISRHHRACEFQCGC